MQKLFILIVLLSVSSEGKGHLLDLVSGAHDRVHSAVHGVANSVLGGLNFNIAGQLGVTGHKQQQTPPQREEPETVIVVVEEETNGQGSQGRPNQNGYGLNMNQYGYGQGSYGRPNQYRYGQNNMYNRPGYNFNGNYGPPSPGNHGPPPPPPYNHYGSLPQNNYGQNNYNHHPMNGMPVPNKYGNYYDQKNPMQGYGYQNQNNFGQNQNDPTTQGHVNQNNNYGQNDQTAQGNYNQNNYGTSTQDYNQNDSSTEYENKPVQKPDDKPTEQTTKKPDDGPLFVPLNPNEYVYGGDKISVGAPKRDTDNTKPSASDDEDSPIDIRFQNEK